MNRRVLLMAGLVLGLMLALAVGAAVGAGVVYAALRTGRVAAAAPAADWLRGSQIGLIQAGTSALQVKEASDEPGVVVAGVVPDGPAAKAGVARGDILLKVAGETLDRPGDLLRVLQAHRPGDTLQIVLRHGDQEKTVTVTLGERNGQPYLGLSPCGGGAVATAIGVLAPGPVIAEVVPDSPAAKAGLKPGDVVTAASGEKLAPDKSLADIIAARKPGDSLSLDVRSPGEDLRTVTVTLGENPDKAGAAYLGVKVMPVPGRVLKGSVPFDRLPDDLAPPILLPDGGKLAGTVVGSVADDSAALAAGIRRGDVITAVDGQAVDGPKALVNAVAAHKPGDKLVLTIRRPAEPDERKIEVTLGEDPNKAGAPYLGIEMGKFLRIERFKDGQLPPDGKPSDDSLRFEVQPPVFEFAAPPMDLELMPGGCCDETF